MSPQVSVALLPEQLTKNWTSSSTLAVVIDTLRFTSTACTALAGGARSLRVLSNIDQAKQLAQQNVDTTGQEPRPLLCGERHCERIEGFDLGNSPAEYTADVVAGRQLIFSTTNGTVAVEAAQGASQIVLGSLLNRAALVQWIRHWAEQTGDGAQVWLICAGTDGQVALEDVFTAGAILESLDWRLANDSAWLAFNSWQNVKQSQNLFKQLELARGGANLIAAGFADDLKAVMHVDSLHIVPGQTADGRFEVLTLS